MMGQYRPGRAFEPMTQDHPESNCHDCGGRNPTWYAANELWNKLCGRTEIICPSCFQGRADKAGINVIFTTEKIDNGWRKE